MCIVAYPASPKYIACPKDSNPDCPNNILYATEKIIKTPILLNKVSANEEEKTVGINKIKKKKEIKTKKL